MKRFLTSVAAIAIAAGGLSVPVFAAEAITVVSWGGAYTEAQKKAFYEPFTKATGIAVNSVDYNGGLGQIKAQVEARNVTWDVVVGEKALAETGCFDNILEKQDAGGLPAATDGTAASEDFVEGTLSDCGIGSVIWSTSMAYNTSKLADGPKTIADFFDLEKFPGKRGLRKSADVESRMGLAGGWRAGFRCLQGSGDQGGGRPRLRETRYDQVRRCLVGGGLATAAASGGWRGRHDLRLQQPYLQRHQR